MKLTRFLLLLGASCLAAEYALNLTEIQTSRGSVAARWTSTSKDDTLVKPSVSSESQPIADSKESAPAKSLEPKPSSSALNSPGELYDFSSYLDKGRVSIVYFYADWCPACRELSPVLRGINENDPEMQVLFLDIAEWNSPIAHYYDVKYVPYLRVYDPRGSLVLEGRAASDWVRNPGTRHPIR